MRKKISFFVIIIVLIAVGIFLYTQLRSQTTINSGISARAKEYMKAKGESIESGWANVQLEPTALPQSTLIDQHDCFSVTVFFPISTRREDRKCYGRYTFTRPRGNMVVFSETTTNVNLDENSHVKLRRSRTDEYEEYTRQLNDKEFIIFKNKNAAYERNAFLLSNGKLLILNVTMYSTEGVEERFLKMLESVKVY